MEQCKLSKPATRFTGFRLVTVCASLILWTQMLQAGDIAPERDYVLPGEARGGFIRSPSSIQSEHAGADKQSATVSYQAFDGSTHTLATHDGHYVTVLLPTSTAPYFTQDQIEELVDRLDILYSNYREIMQAEPKGPGLLTVAFVPETCGLACGYIGFKGIEVHHDLDNYQKLAADLEAGRLDALLNHEMAHNFDLYSDYLHYLPDHAHAWTDMFEFFAPYRFAKDSNDLQQPDDLYQSPSRTIWQPYLATQSADWANCVRDQLCHAEGLTENKLWAMIYFRIEALHGIEAVLDSFAFLKDYAQHHVPPKSTQEKEDLRLMSLAAGANANISCYLDTLKWSVSPTLRNDLQQQFGSGNALCADNDQDGYSLVEGDCNDHNADRSPGLVEIKGNSIDDDCDQVTDEEILSDSAETDLPGFAFSLVTRQLPLEIDGILSGIGDRDAVRFALPPNGRVEVELCGQKGFDGWVTGLGENGHALESAFWFNHVNVAGCSRKTFDFGSLTTGNLEVLADQAAGPYTLRVSKAVDSPQDYSQLFRVLPAKTGGMNIVVEDTGGLLSAMGTDELEIWISGKATRLSRPYASHMTIPLNGSSAGGLDPGALYQARIRPRKNGYPLAAFSAGQLFRYEASPHPVPSLDSGYSGAWYDPKHDGEGLIIEVHEGSQALVYWFTYTPGGEQRWMIGVGEVQDNAIVIKELLHPSGGHFGDAFNPDDVTFQTSGSLSVSFLDCNNAILNYSVDNNGDHQILTRLSEVQGHRCGHAAESLNADLSGSWYDPAHAGEGFVVQQLTDEQTLVYWFSYTTEGKQAWMFNTGLIEDGDVHITELLQASGGKFGRSFTPASVSLISWGTLEMQLDCNGGSAIYNSDAADFTDGSQQLVPLTRLQHSNCAP